MLNIPAVTLMSPRLHAEFRFWLMSTSQDPLQSDDAVVAFLSAIMAGHYGVGKYEKIGASLLLKEIHHSPLFPTH